MQNIKIIENIMTDLRKIEYALRVENASPEIYESISSVIISIYENYILNKNNIIVNSDNLSELYFVIMQYPHIPTEEKNKFIEDIIFRMQTIIHL